MATICSCLKNILERIWLPQSRPKYSVRRFKYPLQHHSSYGITSTKVSDIVNPDTRTFVTTDSPGSEDALQYIKKYRNDLSKTYLKKIIQFCFSLGPLKVKNLNLPWSQIWSKIIDEYFRGTKNTVSSISTNFILPLVTQYTTCGNISKFKNSNYFVLHSNQVNKTFDLALIR